MTTILGAAVSGMVHNQTVLDVVGSNLANDQSPAYKRIRVLAEGRPNAAPSGESTRMGVSETTLDRMFDVGQPDMTGDPLHFAINDDSFFRVRDFDGTVVLTRLGALTPDAQGNITGSRGRLLEPPVTIPEGLTSPSIDPAGTITARASDGTVEVLGQITLTRFTNPQGLESLGDGLYREGLNSGASFDGLPASDGFTALTTGAIEGSNVDMAQEFTEMIIAQRAYQASVRAFSVGDSMLSTATNLTR